MANKMTIPAPPIDIWGIAEELQGDDEERFGLPRSDGPLDKDINEKLDRFDSWDQIYATSLTSMDSVLIVERFLNKVYGITGLFRKW